MEFLSHIVTVSLFIIYFAKINKMLIKYGASYKSFSQLYLRFK